MIKHFLNFKTDGFGRHEIEEPIGFDALNYTNKQDDGFGRDSFFATGSDLDLTFTNKVHKVYFDKLTEYYDIYGYEAEVTYEVEFFNQVIIGLMDFQYAETNGIDVFSCKLIQQSSESIIKKRAETEVNLFNEKDIYGKDISPVETKNILLRAKKSFLTSELNIAESRYFDLGRTPDDKFGFVFPTLNSVKTGLKTTLSGSFFGFTEDFSQLRNEQVRDFVILRAESNIFETKIKISFSYLIKSYKRQVITPPNGYMIANFKLFISDTAGVITERLIDTKQIDLDVDSSRNGVYQTTLPFLERGSEVYLAVQYQLRQSAFNINSLSEVGGEITFNQMNITLEGNSQSYNTIVKGVRLYDAFNQNLKSVSDLTLKYPLAQKDGYLYNLFLVNGAGLRAKQRAFYTSLDFFYKLTDIHKGGYEVEDNNTLFVGEYENFYTNQELYVTDKIVFDDYKKYINPRYAINRFGFKFDKFQSQNENEQSNSFDIIHGSAFFSIANKGCENKREITVPIVLDSFLIEQEKLKAIGLDDTTATKEDDSIFGLDCLERNGLVSFTENFEVRHRVVDGNLVLTNSGGIDFSLLGLRNGDSFIITNTANSGNYTVTSNPITEREITVFRVGGAVEIGSSNTRITYFPTDFDYITRGVEGIDSVSNLINPESFANIRFSVKRCIEKWYKSDLSACNFFTNGQPIRNTFYSKNKECIISFDGLTTQEGEDVIVDSPILSNFMHEVTILISFENYLKLVSDLKTKRGFVRIYTHDGFFTKVYPQEMVFTFSSNIKECKLTIKGEEKKENEIINIDTSNPNVVVINQEYGNNRIKYKEKRNKIFIFDDSNRLLYKPTFWQKVTVNNVKASNLNELKTWLTSLS